MSTLALTLVILIVLTAVSVGALVGTVRRDGYGSRPAPASHHDWDDGLRPRAS